ncbi:hypothetical protein HYS94_01890 [Candidatus Daviesbacteria bacterium]|nr:hypothetical protein [Candidatus Daviesbacteria bacterium]
MNKLDLLNDFLEKARVYLQPGEKPPENVQVYQGKRGGKYYLSRTGLAEKWYSKPKQKFGALAEQDYPTLESRKQVLLTFVPPMYRDKKVTFNPKLLKSSNPKMLSAAKEWLVKWVAKDGKEQVAYSQNHQEKSDIEKWNRMKVMSKKLPLIRKLYNSLLDSKEESDRAIGAIISLLDITGFRIGKEQYAEEHGTYGISSLRCSQVRLLPDSKIELNFIGKKGVEFKGERFIVPNKVYNFLSRCKLSSKRMDKIFPVDEGDVYKVLSDFGVSAKDFRTYHANRLLFSELISGPQYKGNEIKRENRVKEIIKEIAERLGHNWTTSRKAYMNPFIVRAYLDKEDLSEFGAIYKEDIDLEKSYASDKCMECKMSPVIELLWAEGMAHAWFCDKHYKEFKKEHSDDISSERELKWGVASKHWKNGVPTKEDALKLEKNDAYPLNPDSEEMYKWIDDNLIKSGLVIGGKQPQGAKTIGRQIEQRLYSTLQVAIDKYLSSLTGTEPKTEVIEGLIEVLKKWKEVNGPVADEAFEKLFKAGFQAGTMSAGRMGTYDKLAMDIIKNGKYRIGERIVLFADDVVKDFAKIITKAYTPEGIFSLQSLVKEMNEAVPSKRSDLERISRTETSNISNLGRIFGWGDDKYKYFYNYIWNSSPDTRRREMKKMRSEWSPLTFDEALYLWTHNKQQLSNGKWQNGNINCRCSLSRTPREDEYKGNRFEGQPIFEKTLDFSF